MTVSDPTGAVIKAAQVTIANAITGYRQTAPIDPDGHFRLSNIPPNNYTLTVMAEGFAVHHQEVSVHTTVPINLTVSMALAGARTTVTVQAEGAVLLEDVPYMHTDMDRSTYDKLPINNPGGGLSEAIMYGTPGVVADGQGFFHPIGDHAETSFSIDGQPIADQQSKLFSTQLPLSAIQSMELITGTPNAEYGGKTSLVVDTVTRSGLGLSKATGSVSGQFGSFGTGGGGIALGLGGPKFGNFIALDGVRSGRFLDTPEFGVFHDRGNNNSIFDRIDYKPDEKDSFHLNLFLARNWFQIPTTFDQLAVDQDQRQQTRTFNIAPGYQRTVSPRMLLTLNAYYRQDFINYYPSRDPFQDIPATVGQTRKLRNTGVRGDVSYVSGIHNIKVGGYYSNTGLSEDFNFAISDPTFNPVCLDSDGNPVTTPTLINPAKCAGLGYTVNPTLQPGLIPLDLTRGGSPFVFRGRHNINEAGFFVQDTITIHGLVINAGFRLDRYDGLVSGNGPQPRIAASYLIKPTGTVIHAGYARAYETPYNENLILSSATGAGGLAQNVFGAQGQAPLIPATRNEYNVGLQQRVGRFLLIDADEFWKYTNRAFDFDTLFNTPIVFPIQWAKSKIDGVSARVSTINFHGFTAFNVLGHVRARYFGPEVGGILFNSPINQSVFRIDHDQAFNQTTTVRYQKGKDGIWGAFTWRYDSGLVTAALHDVTDILNLTASQQVTAQAFCGSQFATLTNPITTCDPSKLGAKLLSVPAAGSGNDDHSPTRVAPRNLFNVAVGTDNLLRHKEGPRMTANLTVTNLANKVALYNFLSTFSGTHFVPPRAYTASVGFVF